LASSPEAIYQSLKSHRERLEKRLKAGQDYAAGTLRIFDDQDDFEELPAAKREEIEKEIISLASAANNPQELEEEINSLRRLESQANDVRHSNTDSKWERLREIWQKSLPEMEKSGQARKLIIFTEHRATLNYLTRQLGNLLKDPRAIVEIHGGIPQDRRRAIQNQFWNDARTQILVATDAAGEGINLQCAHLMVNYDLPWNPNRLEQRFGRIHRIGQEEVCHLWNIVPIRRARARSIRASWRS